VRGKGNTNKKAGLTTKAQRRQGFLVTSFLGEFFFALFVPLLFNFAFKKSRASFLIRLQTKTAAGYGF